MDEVTYDYESPLLDPNQPRWHNAFKRAVYSHRREEYARKHGLPLPKQGRTKRRFAKVDPNTEIYYDHERPPGDDAR